MKRRLLLAALLLLLAALAAFSGFAQRPEATFPVIVVFNAGADFRPYLGRFQADERVAANPPAWIYLDRGVAGAVQALEAAHGFRAEHVYSAAIRGFAARLSARQIGALERDPLVAYVEADGIMQAVAQPSASSSPQVLPWGIDKIDADRSSTVAGDGSGVITNVNAYIIDTGIDTTHPDLNVVQHVNFAGGKNVDCNGHGTHVAGTVGARDNTIDVVGVAPGLPLTGVKVLGCGGSGTTSGVIKGVDWVTANHSRTIPAVANMSLGGGASQALDDAIRNSVTSGVFYGLAAGNEGADACNSSPARAGAGANNGIMTAAATDSSDREASWSNYGDCVDIWAPGVSILSTKLKGGTTTMSGTSMAAPHVTGGAALYLSTYTGANPASVEAALKTAAVLTGTRSKDGHAIVREYVRSF